MPRRTLVSLVLVAMLTVQAFALVANPATAQQNQPPQDPVPGAPGVNWVPQIAMTQSLYVNYPDVTVQSPQPGVNTPTENEPNCSGGTPAQPAPGSLYVAPKPVQAADQVNTTNSRAPCTYTAVIAGTSPPADQTASFVSAKITRGFNLTANDSLTYQHVGLVPVGLIMNVQVTRNGAAINTVQQKITSSDPTATTVNGFTVSIPLPLNQRPFPIFAGDTIGLNVWGATDPTQTVPGTPPQWAINDTGSRLIVRSSDSLHAATWTEDDSGAVRSLFRPNLDMNTTPPGGVPHIIGFFAVQSAFGLDDADGRGLVAPEFTLVDSNGAPVPVGPNGDGVIPSSLNQSGSDPLDGIAVYTFDSGYLDYRGIQAGSYNLSVAMPYHQGGGFRFGITAPILLSSQSVTLAPYQDPTTTPPISETTAHTVGAGATTTYVLAITNTGAVTDSFRLDATLVSGSGWSVDVSGPQVTDRVVNLSAGQSSLVTVRIGSPGGDNVGDASIFQVVAQSLLDVQAHSTPVILTSTVSDQVTTDLRILAPATTVNVQPGVETRTPVYVWNTGNHPENVTLAIEDTPSPGWTIQLEQGGQGSATVVLPNVAAGALAEVDVSATGPQNEPAITHDITLNATDTDQGGIALDLQMHFALVSTTGVRLQVLEAIGAINHTVMVDGNVGGQACDTGTVVEGCGPADGTDGVLWRVWVTNTGRRGDTFDLTLDNPQIATSTNPRCIEGIFQSGAFGFVYKDPSGHFGDASNGYSITLAPNQTGEVYVFRAYDRTQNPMDWNDATCPPDSFSFVITAKGRATGAVDHFAANVRAVERGGGLGSGNVQNQGLNGKEEDAVLLEPAARLPGYSPSSPFVDLSHMGQPELDGGTQVGQNITYYVRLTTGSNYGAYVDGNGNHVDPTVSVHVDGFNRQGGWNVSIRPANGVFDPNLNPYTDNLTLSNNGAGHVYPFTDEEIEVRVQPPNGQNGTGLALTNDEFTMTAAVGPDVRSVLLVRTFIVPFANITLESDQQQVFAHPGEKGVYLLYVNNTGSSPAQITLSSTVTDATTNAAQWGVQPASEVFNLVPQKNTTIALSVIPPFGATPGSTGEVNVSIQYAPNPFALTQTTNQSLDLTTEVVARGALQLTAGTTDATIGPGGFASYNMTLSNTGTQPVDYQLTGSMIPNWTQTLSPTTGTLQPGASTPVVYVLKAPDDVVNDSRFSSVVRVVQADRPDVFDVQVVDVNIVGGSAIPSLSVPRVQKTVDRAGTQSFEVDVKNLGTASGTFQLSVRPADPTWQAYVQDTFGNNITSVTLGPNELRAVNVTVRAPFQVPEHTLVPIDVLASIQTTSLATAKATLQALIHDYGVHVEVTPARLDAVAGLPTEWTVRIRNDGNDNDTLNLSADLSDLPGWSVDLAATELYLQPGQFGDIKAVVHSPTDPLPIPRTYNLKFYVGTRGGQAVNLSKNESVIGQINVLNYRAMDVDNDGLLELAVDYNKDPTDGFERFYQIFPQGTQDSVVATGQLNEKSNFFLDVPPEGSSPNGIANVWFDPETLYAYNIKYAADVTGDNSPEYFLDLHRTGKIDAAFDAVTGQFYTVTQINAFGDSRIQFLIDLTGSGRPDRFYDPDAKLVTRTINVGDPNLVGIDTHNTGRVDKVYDISAHTVADAKVYGFLDFARQYWYFFAIFLVLVLMTVVLVSRRRREV